MDTQLIPTVAFFFYGYFFVLAVFVIFSLMIIYHLLRFGFFSLINITVIVAYLAVSFALISYSFTVIYGFDWSIQLMDPAIFSNITDSVSAMKL
ncbi:MAG: hypothetical protein WCT26_04095 [Candidatus Buchananbacteria bacterium]|jgi:hypothetical protein